MAIKRAGRPVRKTAAPAPKPQQTFPRSEIDSMTIVELRELAEGLGLDERKLKNNIRAELFAKGYVKQELAVTTPEPQSEPKTTTRRSASKKVEEPQEDDSEISDDEIDKLVADVIDMIKGGVFDKSMALLDEAVGERIDWAIAENKKKEAAAKKRTPAKTTTTAKKTTPPVRRKVDADDEMEAAQVAPKKSASAPTPKPVAKKGPRMVRGVEYVLKGRSGEALVEFVKFGKKDDQTDRTRAIVKLLENYGQRKEGAAMTVPIISLSLPVDGDDE